MITDDVVVRNVGHHTVHAAGSAYARASLTVAFRSSDITALFERALSADVIVT